MNDPEIGVPFQAGATDFTLLLYVKTGYGAHRVLHMSTLRIHGSIPPLPRRSLWRGLIKHKENLTVTVITSLFTTFLHHYGVIVMDLTPQCVLR
jgi:hypothetical protein